MSNSLPHSLYTNKDVRALEALACEHFNLTMGALMKRAGRAVFDTARSRWPHAESLLVVCGGGNNAGDGFVVAALAAQKTIPVKVVLLGDPRCFKGVALQAYQFALQENVTFISAQQLFDIKLNTSTVVVDALLGSGINRNVDGEYREVIEYVNTGESPVIAVDMPSGIAGDTGVAMGAAVNCDLTVTFVGVKAGMVTAQAPAFTGEIVFDDLGLPDELYTHPSAPAPFALRVNLESVKRTAYLKPRQADAHKGQFGHVLVVGGDKNMGGAALMASESALRSGAGRVSLATQPHHVSAALTRCPCAMAVGVAKGADVAPLIKSNTVICVGTGLGQTAWSEQLLQVVTLTENTLLMDADALNLLAQKRVVRHPVRNNWVLTPHPLEAARLLNTTVEEIQNNRFAAVKSLQKHYGGVVVLKGAGTLIACESNVVVANVGTPAMAIGGSGDVLSGIIASLLAQGMGLFEAAVAGVCVHGQAGELAANKVGVIGMVATDMVAYLPEVINS